MARDESGRLDQDGHEDEESSKGRTAAGLALLAAVAVVAYMLLLGGDEYEVTANMENASQVVDGAQVTVAGVPAGTVKQIELAPDNTALITFSVDEQYAPLPQETTLRANPYSLSSVANTQIDLTLPADDQASSETIPDGGIIAPENTISNVSLDEVFNTLDDRTVRNLKKVIKGFEVSYDGVGEQANEGFKYLNPFLSSSRRVFGELNRDERTLERLIVDGSQLSGALAERAPDLEALIGNLNRFQGALAREKENLSETVARFPTFMRRANTTFVNLRAMLDDVDPLVEASKPVAVRLRPFFSEFRGAAENLVPTTADLDHLVSRPGHANDLVDLNHLQPAVTEAALGTGSPECAENPRDVDELQKPADDDYTQGAFGEQICAARDGLPGISMLRAYSPELVGWLDDFGHSGTIDANGGMGRISTTFNTFTPPEQSLPGILPNIFQTPLSPSEASAGLTQDQRMRCPGANERDPGDGSTPFVEEGIACDPTQVPPGP